MSQITIQPTFIKADSTLSFFGFDPYIQTFWLRILGPTATLLMNHLSVCALISNQTQKIETRELSARLGVGSREGKCSPIYKQLNRLVKTGVIFNRGNDEYLVPRAILPLRPYMVHKLEPSARLEHNRWIDSLTISPLSTQRRRVQSLLGCLDAMGINATTQQEILATSGLHPSVIGESISRLGSQPLRYVANL